MMDDAERIAEFCRPCYLRVRILPDGTVAGLGELLTTRAIHLDLDMYGWSRRYCFADRDLASQRFDELQSADDVPQGFIASRPERE